MLGRSSVPVAVSNVRYVTQWGKRVVNFSKFSFTWSDDYRAHLSFNDILFQVTFWFSNKENEGDITKLQINNLRKG